MKLCISSPSYGCSRNPSISLYSLNKMCSKSYSCRNVRPQIASWSQISICVKLEYLWNKCVICVTNVACWLVVHCLFRPADYSHSTPGKPGKTAICVDISHKAADSRHHAQPVRYENNEIAFFILGWKCFLTKLVKMCSSEALKLNLPCLTPQTRQQSKWLHFVTNS